MASHRVAVSMCALAAIPCLSASAQDVRDWLLPQSGFWSDPTNWSGMDVPDSVLETARLSPSPEVQGQTDVVARIQGEFEIARLEGNGVVDLLIDSGGELTVDSGIIQGPDTGVFEITLGSESGSTPAVLIIGDEGGRSAAVSGTDIRMIGGPAFPSALEGPVTLVGSASITGQGEMQDITNYGTITATRIGSGSGELIVSERFLNFGDLRIDPNSTLTIDHGSLVHLGELDNRGTLSLIDSSLSGDARVNGLTRFAGQNTLHRIEFDAGTTEVEGELVITPVDNIFMANRMSLAGGSEISFTENVFLHGDSLSNSPIREIQMQTVDGPARLVAPQGGYIVTMPGFKLRGPGIVEANLVNFAEIDVDHGDIFTARRDVLEIIGDLELQSSSELTIGINSDDRTTLSDQVLVRVGDLMLGGELKISILINMGSDPFNQVAIANERVTLLRVADTAAQNITGTFDTARMIVFDERVSPHPDVLYLDDRVDAVFYCTADVNRNMAVEPSDFTAWIAAYQSGSPLADMNSDGMLTQSDFTKWIDLYNRGCE